MCGSSRRLRQEHFRSYRIIFYGNKCCKKYGVRFMAKISTPLAELRSTSKFFALSEKLTEPIYDSAR